MQDTLKVNDIFYSIQGEGSQTGLPCIFVRLAGCNLRCSYCDTKSAWSGGKETGINKILESTGKFPSKYICITGGEPLMQENTCKLIKKFLELKFKVSLETNGCVDLSGVPEKTHVTMDLKCPGSGESGKNMLENMKHLKKTDDLKFVVSGRKDYEWARKMLSVMINLPDSVFFSPAHGRLSPGVLASWLMKDGLEAKLQVQLHKVIGLK